MAPSSRVTQSESPSNFSRLMDDSKEVVLTPLAEEQSPSNLLTPDAPRGKEPLEIPSSSCLGVDPKPSFESQLCYEAESPDEAALVHAARAYSCILQSRKPDEVTIHFSPLGRLTFKLLHILPFDAVRKRMSIVVRHPILKQVVVYTKGADSVIMDLLQQGNTGRDDTLVSFLK